MLKRHIARLGAAVILMVACIVTIQSPAHADYIYCPPNNGPCIIIAPGGGGGGGGGGPGGGSSIGKAICLHEQLGEVPCYRGGMGWFNPIDACYYIRLTLTNDDPLWNGNDPAKGNMYGVNCWGGASAGWERVAIRYLTSEPPGYGGLPSLIDLVLRAIALLPLEIPDIRTAPGAASAGAVGLVGLPVWLWVNDPDWGPVSASAEAPPIRVEATAKVTHIDWLMGDGSTVTCQTPGTAYSADRKDSPSPDCGYKYLRPSRDACGGLCTVRATTYWVVDWRGGGRSGQLTVQRYSEVGLRINELQVVVQ